MSRTTQRTLTALTLAMAMALPAPAFAAPPAKPETSVSDPGPMANLKVTRDQAVAIAKQYFQVPAELGEPNINVYQNKDDATWNISWYGRGDVGGKYAGYSVSVSIDATTGDVRNYYHGQPMTDELAEAKLTRQEALVKAQSWVDRLAGAYKTQLQYMDHQNNPYYWYGSSYSFTWQRTLFGYPVAGSAINININAITGELDNYNFNWQKNLDYEAPTTFLAKDKAQDLFLKNVALELQYQYFMKPGTNTGEWRLIYRPVAGFPFITQDGKAVDGAAKEISLKPVTRTPLPALDTPWQAPDKELSGDQALALAMKITGKTAAPNNSSYGENGDKQKVHYWSFSWYTPTPNGSAPDNADVQVDADRGVVTSFNRCCGGYEPLKENEQPKLTYEEAQKVAVDFVRTARPDLAGKAVLFGYPQPVYDPKMGALPPTYSFQFGELKNDIRIVGREFNVEVDVRTGQVRGFYSYRNPNEMSADFPTATDLVPAADAVKSLVEAAGLTQSWSTFWTPVSQPVMEPRPGKSMLVWSLNQTLPLNAIDAKTGIPIDYNGRDVLEAAKQPSDIEGNFAQREIELLWARGIFELKDGKFNPNDAITMADLFKWMVQIRGMGIYNGYNFTQEFATAGASADAAKTIAASAAAPYVASALQSQIILPEDFKGAVDMNGPVNRELFALWAVRALGYGQIAKMPLTIELPFTDKDQIAPAYANSVAILGGLGIVKGNADGKFEPKRSLTRAEAVKILYAITTRPRIMKY